ncbi:MAG: BON domain-containing protein [Chitinophagaceae bacterium]|nr:BON domain-containing protein [Chitinophagaceae bacterium]
MQQLLKLTLLFLLSAAVSCKSGPTDEQINQEVSSTLTGGVTASVKDGVVTLSGTCPDEPCKSSSETSAKNAKGVKSVVNNIVVSAPPPPVEMTQTDSLKKSVDALVASYKTVQATVDNGVVTLTGEIKRSQLTTLMQSVNELKPKKVENKLVIK